MDKYIKTQGGKAAVGVIANSYNEHHAAIAARKAHLAQKKAEEEAAKSREELQTVNAKLKKLEASMDELLKIAKKK